MWRNSKLVVLAGLATASVLALLLRRALRAAKSSIFIVQDRSLLANVKKVETVVGPLQVMETVNGRLSSFPPPAKGQFDASRVLIANGAGVAKYAGNILYLPTTTSTSEVIQTCFPDVPTNLVVVCDEQTAGRGRTGNWVSLNGCLMFTYKFTCELQYALPIQTLIPLAMVMAITKRLEQSQGTTYAVSHVRVKWPNDIYLGKAKIGGILVDAETRGSLIHMNIGIGVNVDNDQPTTCLNSQFKNMFTREGLLVRYLNAFEEIVVKLKTGGVEDLQRQYEERWYHKDTEATYLPTGEPVTLIGVDLFSGLKVKLPSGEIKVIQTRDELRLLP